jgi:hypothetical protein
MMVFVISRMGFIFLANVDVSPPGEGRDVGIDVVGFMPLAGTSC